MNQAPPQTITPFVAMNSQDQLIIQSGANVYSYAMMFQARSGCMGNLLCVGVFVGSFCLPNVVLRVCACVLCALFLSPECVCACASDCVCVCAALCRNNLTVEGYVEDYSGLAMCISNTSSRPSCNQFFAQVCLCGPTPVSVWVWVV